MNELHKKYYDKGLRVYGMDVWEDEKDKVEKFVKKKSSEMTYPVAFTGGGSAFEKEWLVASGAKAIPHAFIVRNGKLLAATEASRLTDSLIESLLSGDEGAKKAADTIISAQKNQKKTDALSSAIRSAAKKKDAEKMGELLKELKGLDPGHPEIGTLELRVLLAAEDWPAAVTALNELPASELKRSFVSMNGSATARLRNNYSEDFVKALVPHYTEYVMDTETLIGPNHFVNLSILQWRFLAGQITTAFCLLLGFLITFIDGQSNYFWFCSFMISIGFFDRRIGRGDIIAGILFGAFSASFLATS